MHFKETKWVFFVLNFLEISADLMLRILVEVTYLAWKI